MKKKRGNKQIEEDQRVERLNRIFMQIRDMLEKEGIKDFFVTVLTHSRDDKLDSVGVVPVLSQGKLALMISEGLKTLHYKRPEEIEIIIRELFDSIAEWYRFDESDKTVH